MPPLHVLPCILNRQSRVKLSVAAGWSASLAGHRGPYSKDINIATVGAQPGVTLNGPDFECSLAEDMNVDWEEAEAAHAAQKHAQGRDDDQGPIAGSDDEHVPKSMRWSDARAVVAHDRAVPEAVEEVDKAVENGGESSLADAEREVLQTAAREASAAVAQPQGSVAESAAGSMLAQQPSEASGMRSGDVTHSPRSTLQHGGQLARSPLRPAAHDTERYSAGGAAGAFAASQPSAAPRLPNTGAPPSSRTEVWRLEGAGSDVVQGPAHNMPGDRIGPGTQASAAVPSVAGAESRVVLRATIRQRDSLAEHASAFAAPQATAQRLPSALPRLPTTESLPSPRTAERRPVGASHDRLQGQQGPALDPLRGTSTSAIPAKPTSSIAHPPAADAAPRAVFRATIRQQHDPHAESFSMRDGSQADSVAMPGPPSMSAAQPVRSTSPA